MLIKGDPSYRGILYPQHNLKLFVQSEALIENFTHNQPYYVISITEPDNNDSKVTNEAVKVLRLKFHDLTPEAKCLNLFDEEMADRVDEFVKDALNNDVDTILCQCYMGRSRSAGIAGALSKFYNDDDFDIFKKYTPNDHVYRVMLNKLMEKK